MRCALYSVQALHSQPSQRMTVATQAPLNLRQYRSEVVSRSSIAGLECSTVLLAYTDEFGGIVLLGSSTDRLACSVVLLVSRTVILFAT